ncbi:hypothetical protein HanRHA438_Chr04g0192361 [Helianthus annuus]|nr:hypothetical protein HanRHA438_Chr04g0192361 [Helianthus annuus]
MLCSATNDLNASRSESRDRVTMRLIRVSIWVSCGRSSKFTGGRMIWLRPMGSESRKAFCEMDKGPSFGMMKVDEMLWLFFNLLANSTKGIKCPIPGLGTMAIWGVLSILEREIDTDIYVYI